MSSRLLGTAHNLKLMTCSFLEFSVSYLWTKVDCWEPKLQEAKLQTGGDHRASALAPRAPPPSVQLRVLPATNRCENGGARLQRPDLKNMLHLPPYACLDYALWGRQLSRWEAAAAAPSKGTNSQCHLARLVSVPPRQQTPSLSQAFW